MNKMENNAPQIVEKDSKQFSVIFRMCLGILRANWYWFVISVVIALVLGHLYYARQPRVYSRQAVMLIEDASGTGGGYSGARKSRGGMNTLLELNGISVGDNLKNEIFILSSKRLMARVVDSLSLDVDYTTTESLHNITLYLNRPLEVEFDEKAKTPSAFKVNVQADGRGGYKYVLSDFQIVTDGEQPETTLTVVDGQRVNTPSGWLTIRGNKKQLAKVKADKDITVTHYPVKTAAAIWSSRISVAEMDKESSLIVLGCSDTDPRRAEDVLNEVFTAYKQDVVDNKNRVANNTARFIDERLELIGQDLSGVEEQLAAFKSSNQLIDFSQNAQTFITETAAARKQTIELETQLSVARYLVGFLTDRSNTRETIPVLALESASFTPLITEYNRMLVERGGLVENSSESAPAVRELDRQLASQKQAILSSLSSYVSSVELELQRAKNTEASLYGKMGAVPEKEKQGLDIQRQQELKSSLYTYLLNKREEVALQMAISEANVRMVEEPLGPKTPVKPRRMIILAVSLLLGLLVPSAIFWLRHMLNVTITGRKDVEDATTIPIAGEIPHWEGHSPNGIISTESPDAPIMEAFRLLRYGLNFMRHSAKVFVVTSATPSQGKSFISMNLAFILGQTGKRTLFIDTDIRRRTASLQLGNSRGLTALLAESEEGLTLSDVVLVDVIGENVDVLPVGKMPPNPTELLMSDRFDDVIEQAKMAYDYIVVDTTPTLAVADAAIVHRVADITLF